MSQICATGFGQGGFTDTQAAHSNRVTSNQNRLNDLIAEHSGMVKVVTLIDLPKSCESQFTTRDDSGIHACSSHPTISERTCHYYVC